MGLKTGLFLHTGSGYSSGPYLHYKCENTKQLRYGDLIKKGHFAVSFANRNLNAPQVVRMRKITKLSPALLKEQAGDFFRRLYTAGRSRLHTRLLIACGMPVEYRAPIAVQHNEQRQSQEHEQETGNQRYQYFC